MKSGRVKSGRVKSGRVKNGRVKSEERREMWTTRGMNGDVAVWIAAKSEDVQKKNSGVAVAHGAAVETVKD